MAELGVWIINSAEPAAQTSVPRICKVLRETHFAITAA